MALSDNCEAYWALTTSSLTDAINGHVLTATNVDFVGTAPGPYRVTTNSGGSILRTSTLTLTEPFTMLAQIYVNGSASDFCFFGYALGSADFFIAYQSSGANNHTVRSRSGGSAGDVSGGGVSGGVFNDCGGVWTSSTSRSAFLASTLSSPDTTNIAPSGAGTHVSALGLWDGSSILQGAGAGWGIKHWAVWSRALSQAEAVSYFTDPSQVLGGGGGGSFKAAWIPRNSSFIGSR